MTISEMEARSGMTRANIRFYESEGLIKPQRKENGYRDYSEEDLEILLRIRLLRSVHIPLEEIKALQAGEEELTDALDRQLQALAQEQDALARSQDLCRAMRRDSVSYDTLHAQTYLDMLAESGEADLELKKDVLPRVRYPFRRFFARSLDWLLYGRVIDVLVSYLFNVYTPDLNLVVKLLLFVMQVGLMFLLEPLSLMLFGTTPGKWLMGLSVTNPDGERLSFKEGADRLGQVIRYGYGYYIPIYNLYRGYKSIIACDGGALPWDGDYPMTIRDTKGWRVAACLGGWVLITAAGVLLTMGAELPRNRGDITVAEFCENYNRLLDYFDLQEGTMTRLDAEGRWSEGRQDGGVTIYIGGEGVRPEFVFTEEDGCMTGLRFEVELTDGEKLAGSYTTEMATAALSFLRAQKGCGYFEGIFRVRDAVAGAIGESHYTDFCFTSQGVTVSCDYEYRGYDLTGFGLWPREGEETYYRVTFTMTKDS